MGYEWIIPLDLPGGYMGASSGPFGIVAWEVPAIMIEAAVLHYALEDVSPLRDSAIMNLITTGIGFGMIFILPYPLYMEIGTLIGLENSLYYGNRTAFSLSTLAFAVILGIIGIPIEVGVMRLLEPETPQKRVWKAVALANLITYLLGSIISLLFLIP